MKTHPEVPPKARTSEVLVEELVGETLVYDLARNKAHYLNDVAALVWRHCDGVRSSDELARIVAKEKLATSDDAAKVVAIAVARLERARLFEPRPHAKRDISRRDAMKKIGLAAALTPIVTSFLAPTAAYAASDTCTGTTPTCNFKVCPRGKT